MGEKLLRSSQCLEQMRLKEAIKTCLEAGIDVSCFETMNSIVWLPPELFLKWFGEYITEGMNENCRKLVAVENGVEYKCYVWKGE